MSLHEASKIERDDRVVHGPERGVVTAVQPDEVVVHWNDGCCNRYDPWVFIPWGVGTWQLRC